MEQTRSSFSGKLGFILAAAGSAVGLGNIWRFPYLAAKYGGGIFLLVYVILAITLGFTLMTAEIALGRKTGLSAVGAYKKLNKRFGFLGTAVSLVPIIITPYYCVIGGWVIKYLVAFCTGQAEASVADGYFTNFIGSSGEPLLWFAVFALISLLIVVLGVETGIEKVSKVMMPVLVVLTLGVAIYSMFLPGAGAGLVYYLKPDFSNFSVLTVLNAMGQMFYSMSLAMGIMVTYGSYMKKSIRIESSVRQIEIFDTGIAFLAGLMIIPAVFAFSGGDASALNAGPGLMFITLPKVFASMPGGTVIGIVFFLLVLLAALTSAISLMETVVSIFQDKFHFSRKAACVAVFVICVLLGVPSSMGNGAWSGFTIIGMDFLSFCDFITNSVLMPLVAIATCIFIGWVMKPEIILDEAMAEGQKFGAKKLFRVVIRYVAPICITAILVFSVLSGLGVINA